MVVVGCLPVVENCCCSIDLKIGSIIIAIISIIFAGIFIGARVTGITAECTLAMGNSVSKDTTDAFDYLTYVAAIILCITAIAFLIGIFVPLQITAKLYVFAGLAVLILQAVAICFTLVMMFLSLDSCKTSLIPILPQVIFPGLLLYFIIIANSYEGNM